MNAKQYQKQLWKDVNLHELNKFLKTHAVSCDTIENEIVLNEKILKRPRKEKYKPQATC